VVWLVFPDACRDRRSIGHHSRVGIGEKLRLVSSLASNAPGATLQTFGKPMQCHPAALDTVR
jgi:hypothetical protein